MVGDWLHKGVSDLQRNCIQNFRQNSQISHLYSSCHADSSCLHFSCPVYPMRRIACLLPPLCSLSSLEKLLKGRQRAAVIISSMLGFARNHSTQRELVDLVGLIEEVLILTEKDLSKHQVHVATKFEGRPKAPVVRGQIEQILLN